MQIVHLSGLRYYGTGVSNCVLRNTTMAGWAGGGSGGGGGGRENCSLADSFLRSMA